MVRSELHLIVQRKLEELGTTEDEVGLKLMDLGHRGYPDEPATCPVAKYLRKETGYYTEVAGAAYVKDVQVPLPDPVCEFVDAFDSGQWPDLEKERSTDEEG